jgi:hypothetical protein
MDVRGTHLKLRFTLYLENGQPTNDNHAFYKSAPQIIRRWSSATSSDPEGSSFDDLEIQLQERPKEVSENQIVDWQLLALPFDPEFESLLHGRKAKRKIVRMADFTKAYMDRLFTDVWRNLRLSGSNISTVFSSM